MKTPEFQDEVKHKTADMAGVVVAKYPSLGKWLLDVRGSNERIYYATPMENWEVVRTAYERGQV